MTKFQKQKFSKTKDFLNEKKIKRVELSSSSLRILLFGLILFVSFSYLYYINQTATGGFDIKGIENRIEDIKKENKLLELKSAELQSLVKIEEASQELQMVATTTIEYLPAVGSTIAVR